LLNTVTLKAIGNPKLWDSNILIIFGRTPRTQNYFIWDFFGIFFFMKCRVKEEREVKRNVSYSDGQVVEGNTR
jgi:hypothetical protein